MSIHMALMRSLKWTTGLALFAAHAASAASTPPEVVAVGRMAFVRGEEDARIALVLKNKSEAPVAGPKVVFEQLDSDGKVAARGEMRLGDIMPNEEKRLYPRLETRLRPGPGRLNASFSGSGSGGEPVAGSYSFEFWIGRQVARTLPVIHDGYWRGDAKDKDKVKHAYTNTLEAWAADFGYTHLSGNTYRFRTPEWPGLPSLDGEWGKEMVSTYDRFIVSGIRRWTGMYLQFNTNWIGKAGSEFLARDKDGNPMISAYKTTTYEYGEPGVQMYMRMEAKREAEIYGSHPALTGMISMSERRDKFMPSFGGGEERRYEFETGRKIPQAAKDHGKRTFDEKLAQKRFPDGVVDDDDPLLSYYRWYWAGGDGWPNTVNAANDGFREALPASKRGSFTLVWEPAVRCPPIWGSGTATEMINQWCYANPEPLNIAGPAEECFAMAEGHPGQRVMMSNQIIIYRVYVAPDGMKVDNPPRWAVEFPKARFPGVPPDVLTESTWAMIAKPVEAIKFHGWGCIFDTGSQDFYVYTNPEVGASHSRMIKEVIAPLGPMLLDLKRADQDVAVLESFTTSIFGHTGNSGWGWTAPSITFVQRARLDPKVVYEEKVLSPGGLDGVKVLYLPQCRYLTRKVLSAVKDFQARGGIVVADKMLPKCVSPDVVVPEISFDPPPAADSDEAVSKLEAELAKNSKTTAHAATRRAKELMLLHADGLRKALAGRYEPFADSSSPELVTFNRQWGDVPYLFVINDKRDFGDYVGPWGRLMEKGMPYSGWVTVRDPGRNVAAVYELSKGCQVPFVREGDRVRLDVSFDTCDGRLFAFLPAKIDSLKVKVSESVRRGEEIVVALVVADASGRAVPAILPVEVRVYDAAGRELDGAGYAAAKDGKCRVSVLTNINDAPGDYKVVCRDRASGISRTLSVKCR